MIYISLAAYNEERNIAALLEGLARTCRTAGLSARVYIVNDGSTDQTIQTIERTTPADLPVVLINQENRGFLAALTRVLQETMKVASDGDICITMDADNTHPPDLIPRMVQSIQDGHDLVIASRYEREGKMIGVPPHRVFFSHAARWVMALLVGVPNVRDYSSAYRAYHAEFLARGFEMYSDDLFSGKGFSGLAGSLLRLNYLQPRVCEVPLVLRYDFKQGVSQMRIWNTIQGYLDILWGHFRGRFRPHPHSTVGISE